MYSKEVINMFPDLTQKYSIGFFHRQCLSEVFETSHEFYLQVHARFDYLVSGSQVCQKYKS